MDNRISSSDVAAAGPAASGPVAEPRAAGLSDAAGRIDLRGPGEPWQARRAAGKALRRSLPRARHADWSPDADRPDPVSLIEQSNRGRIEALVPLRNRRMAASPFAFLRGAATVMARDLSSTPTAGMRLFIDGDAHLGNFGLYGTPQRDVVFDLNDFDETTIGPWEWDLKRLTASVNVLARENGLGRAERRAAAARTVEAYRTNMTLLAARPVLDVWHLYSYAEPDRVAPLTPLDDASRAVLARAVERARQRTHAQVLDKTCERAPDGSWRFRSDPPILTRVDDATRERVADAIERYACTIATDWQYMLCRYRVADVAHRVVGVGSVGTRAYLALLLGNGHDDPLFLQVKEAVRCAYAPYLPPLPAGFEHDGHRVVHGQRLLQASTDLLLGWTSIGERAFYVRQFKNMKGSIPIESLTGAAFSLHAWVIGLLLARAHARTGDAAAIAGYCGRSAELDEAIATWAEAYGDQTVRDHAAFVEAIAAGRLEAVPD